MPKPRKFPTFEAHWDVIQLNHPTPCHIWKGTKNTFGYGKYKVSPTRYKMAHKLTYEMRHNINIPSNMCLDHLCRNTSCVNPEHLEMVTMKENMQRSVNCKASPVYKNKS